MVERDRLLDGSTIVEGDALLGVPSSGVHTNGFSLVRRVFDTDGDRTVLFRHYDELKHTLGEELLIPHRAYYPLLEPVLPLIKGMAHITGGGLAGNVPRVLPEGLEARFRAGSWEVHPIFQIIQREGNVDPEEMFRVFNMGLGMVLVCSPDRVGEIQATLPEARVVGQVQGQTVAERVVVE